MGFLLLAVGCSLLIAVLLKMAEAADAPRVGMLTVNYLVASASSLGMLAAGGTWPDAGLPAGLWLFGMATGGVFIAGFFVFSLATRRAGMSLSVGVMRVSVVVPVVFSWMVWAEEPSAMQAVGLVLAGGAFFLLAGRRGPRLPGPKARAGAMEFLVLLLLFLVAGLTDVCLKGFEEVYSNEAGPSVFTALIFTSAFGIGAMRTTYRSARDRRLPPVAAWTWGVPLGVANLGSVEFMLRALGELPAPFAFPVNNILIVLGAALLGTTLWRERLSRMNWIGLGMAAVALVLMNL